MWRGIDEPDLLKSTNADTYTSRQSTASSPVMQPTFDLVIEALINSCWITSAINEIAVRLLSRCPSVGMSVAVVGRIVSVEAYQEPRYCLYMMAKRASPYSKRPGGISEYHSVGSNAIPIAS